MLTKWTNNKFFDEVPWKRAGAVIGEVNRDEKNSGDYFENDF